MVPSTSGRVAVVTGANKGIGYFIALHLGLPGLFQHVLLACRDASRASSAVDTQQALLPSSVQVSATPLTLGDPSSQLKTYIETNYGKLDCLVHNAAMAYKNADPTPFAQQTKPTLDVNFRGTVDLTEQLWPLLEKGSDPRVVTVASMSGRLSQVSPELQRRFSSPSLTLDQLHALVGEFEAAVADGSHKDKGWSNSNYGISKLAVIAATRVWARAHPNVSVNCCCPGYCKTDMTSQGGVRDPKDGAKNAAIPATMENPPTGEFFANYEVARW